MAFEVTGKLYKKFDTAQVTNTFQKREFVLEVEDGAYSQLIKFQLIQDKCETINDFNENDEVKVSFNLRGREWTNKQGEKTYFTNLQAWRVEGASSGGGSAAPTAPPASDTTFPSLSDAPADTDDLPF